MLWCMSASDLTADYYMLHPAAGTRMPRAPGGIGRQGKKKNQPPPPKPEVSETMPTPAEANKEPTTTPGED